ncbi:TolC family outer membrane protein [Paracoccus sp. p4-l81]|uniref:TolC family outer membrane protein n=1 Tax=unclassified Paracoccus (in: a-proteobacteria) TaxID=2688777 RepID=UPI0035B81599
MTSRLRKFLGAGSLGLALSLSAALTSTAAWAESLADAMVAAYRSSDLLDQNRAVLRAADEDVATAVASLRPVVQWIASTQFSKAEIRNGPTVDTLQASLSLSAQMTLYDFGRSQLAIDMAKETVLATREALIDVEQNVLLNAVKSYMDVRAATQQVDLNQNSVRVIREESRAAQDRFDVGEVTRTDVSLAEARLAATRAGLAAAEGQLASAREAYKAATGKAPGKLSAPPKPPKLPKSLDEARNIAMRSHPLIRQAQREAAAAELRVAMAAAERRPNLTGSAGISLSDADSTNPTTNTRTTVGANVGLQMSQTVYSGGRLPAAHRKAMAGRDAARAGLSRATVLVGQQVGTAWANIDVARASISAIDEQISAARAAYNGVREEASLGARTTLDVLDAEQSLLNAQADRISAESSLQLAYYSLLSSMGLLTAENLKLGLPTYDPSAYYNAVKDAPYTSTQGDSLDRVLRAIGKN